MRRIINTIARRAAIAISRACAKAAGIVARRNHLTTSMVTGSGMTWRESHGDSYSMSHTWQTLVGQGLGAVLVPQPVLSLPLNSASKRKA